MPGIELHGLSPTARCGAAGAGRAGDGGTRYPEGETILPASIGRLEVYEAIPVDEPLTVHASLQEIVEQAAHGSFRLLAADGRLVAEAADVMLARVRPADSGPLGELLYDATWRPTALEAGAAPLRVLLLAGDAARRRRSRRPCARGASTHRCASARKQK